MPESTSATPRDSRTAALDEALAVLDTWPVDAAAAAVIAPSSGDETRGDAPGGASVLATHGDTSVAFELASVTKLLSAAAVLLAVEEGAIELDTPAGPEGSTVRHLLAHASGVAFDSRTPKAAPGAKRIYSSAGYEILADLVAESTGIDFPGYLREGVADGLGMTSTVLDGSAGHGARGSVDDLARLAAEMLAPRLLAAETWDAATGVAFPELDGLVPGYGMQKPCPWGLGPEIKGEKSPHWTGETNSAATYGHFGQSGTFLWVDPEARTGAAPAPDSGAGTGTGSGSDSGLALVVLTDRAFGDWAKPLWPALSDAVLAAAGDGAR